MKAPPEYVPPPSIAPINLDSAVENKTRVGKAGNSRIAVIFFNLFDSPRG
jgi:hypothetical protein